MAKVYQVVYGFGFGIQEPLGDYFVHGENETQIKEAFEKVFTDAGMEVPEVTIEEVLPLDLADFIQDIKAAM